MRANDFGANLPELAVTAALGTLAAELRADIKQLLKLAGFAELVFDVGADDAGGGFGAEREGLRLLRGRAGAVFPGEHLLGNDVGFLADSPCKKLGGFKDWGPDFSEAVAGE